MVMIPATVGALMHDARWAFLRSVNNPFTQVLGVPCSLLRQTHGSQDLNLVVFILDDRLNVWSFTDQCERKIHLSSIPPADLDSSPRHLILILVTRSNQFS
jgi:hypothetical protein